MFDLENQNNKNNNYTNFETDKNVVYGHRTSDAESFHDLNRANFVKKVYTILSCQLLLTVSLSAFAMSSSSFFKFQVNNLGLFYFFVFMTIAIMLVLICVPSVAKKVPLNYILLFTFTAAESYIVAFFCGISQGKIVFMAAAMTLAIVCALTFYAMTTKTDFTMQGGLLYILGMALLMLVLFNMFFQSSFLSTLIAAASAVLFGLYLVYDTQLIIGGKNAELELDDYILGALLLYSDIIGLFLEILSLLNRLTGSNEN